MAEWLAWANVRGMPHDRAEFRAGQLCALLANLHRTSESEHYFEPGDFIGTDEPPEARQEEDETAPVDIEATSRAIAALLGRKD